MTPAEPAPRAAVDSPSVYRNPRIGKILLRAHQDAQGRLLGPQVMYQVVEPGGWNIDALDPVPFASAEVAPVAGTQPGEAATNPLLNPDKAANLIITGLMRPGDRREAEALAEKAGGRAALFDEQAGWLLAPVPSGAPADPDPR